MNVLWVVMVEEVMGIEVWYLTLLRRVRINEKKKNCTV